MERLLIALALTLCLSTAQTAAVLWDGSERAVFRGGGAKDGAGRFLERSGADPQFSTVTPTTAMGGDMKAIPSLGGLHPSRDAPAAPRISHQPPRSARAARQLRQRKLRKLALFADPLTILPRLEAPPSGLITLVAAKVQQKLHKDLPATWVYGFGTSAATASTPGPTIVAQSGRTLKVRCKNEISAAQHLFPVDYTLSAPRLKLGGVPISVHVHGAVVSSSFDGHPNAWHTSRGEHGWAFVNDTSEFPNIQPGSTLWYHDHTVGMTRLNVAAGLCGFYLINQSEVESGLTLPRGEFDIPLLLQEQDLDVTTGNISFPTVGDNPGVHPTWVPEYFGNYLLVNGKVSPYLHVSRSLYRFRLLNGANARFFTLFTEPALPFYIVATDGGFLGAPVFCSQFTFGPGERVEILLDFTSLQPGSEIFLKNSAPAPYPEGDFPVEQGLQFVMKFVVQQRRRNPTGARVPANLVSFHRLSPVGAAMTRNITLTEVENANTGEPEGALIEGLHWDDPVTVKPRVGSTEVWNIINLTEDWHPFHIHLAPHQLLWRQPFDLDAYLAKNCSIPAATGGSCFTGAPVPASGAEIAWKDTTLVPSRMVTTLVVRFSGEGGANLPFNATAGPGYVFHCHILDHEDNDMMRPLVLTQ